MTPEQIHEKLKAGFGDDVFEFDGEALDPFIKVNPTKILKICAFLKSEKDLKFDVLMCLSGMDYGAGDEPSLGVIYNLHSLEHNHKITLKVSLGREEPKLPSVESVWRTADWHEREAYDLFGIVFEGHPDLRRILCPDDWEGWPLRKDYVVQEFYHGMRVPYQEDWVKYETLEKNPERGHFVFKPETRVPGLTNAQKIGDSNEGKAG